MSTATASKRKKRSDRRRMPEWRRRTIAADQQWRCNLCSQLLPACFEIDHVVALVNGGADDCHNYQALCPNCHRQKTTYDRFPDRYEEFTGKSKYFYPGPLWLR